MKDYLLKFKKSLKERQTALKFQMKHLMTGTLKIM